MPDSIELLLKAEIIEVDVVARRNIVVSKGNLAHRSCFSPFILTFISVMLFLLRREYRTINILAFRTGTSTQVRVRTNILPVLLIIMQCINILFHKNFKQIEQSVVLYKSHSYITKQ